MVESKVIQYLALQMAMTVHGELEPKDPPNVLIVHGAGIEEKDLTDTERIVIDVYGESRAIAAALTDSVIRTMRQMWQQPGISSSKLVTAYPSPDTPLRKHRYQVIFNITLQ